jgi:hypothetical protein
LRDYIYDGELHALTDKLGYAIKIIEDDDITMSVQDEKFTGMVNDFAKKYNDYRAKAGEKEIEIKSFFPTSEEVQFVYRPKQGIDKATLGIKFLRFPNDGLDES